MRLIKTSSAVSLLLISSVALAGPTINTDKLTKPNPNVKKQLPKTLSVPQKKSLKMIAKAPATIVNGEPSWTFPLGTCDPNAHPDPVTLRVNMNYRWAGESYTNSMPVLLKVKLPDGHELSQPGMLYGTNGNRTPTRLYTSERFDIARGELRCGTPQLCVQVRFAPVNPADVNRVNQVWRPLCKPW